MPMVCQRNTSFGYENQGNLDRMLDPEPKDRAPRVFDWPLTAFLSPQQLWGKGAEEDGQPESDLPPPTQSNIVCI